jgi:hypothetical protein
MHALLDDLTRRAFEGLRSGDRDMRLALGIMHKRALSSAASLERSIRRRLDLVPAGAPDGGIQLTLPLDDRHGEHDVADEPPAWTAPVLDDPDAERRLLSAIADAAHEAAGHESKILALKRLLRRCANRGESAIVFTEYRDTLMHVRALLRTRCVVIHGGLNRHERRAALAGFSQSPGSVLLATDAAGEGLNLHRAARVVINLELPWNPVRLEQRIGRVDRIGQQRTVHAFHLIGRGTGEARILERLGTRLQQARLDIGTSDPLGSLVDAEGTVASDESLKPMRLAADGGREHQHLAFVRVIAKARQAVDTPFNRPLLAFSRRRGTRLALGSAWLLIFRTTAEDQYGRVVASRLVPLRIHLEAMTARGDRECVASLSAFIGCHPTVERLIDATGWMAEVRPAHTAFWSTRLSRELAVAGASTTPAPDPVEPRLFDRRIERDEADRAAVESEERADAARRVAAVREALAVSASRTCLALVLAP